MARSYARIGRAPGKVSGTERDGATPRDASSSEMNSILSLQSPSFVVTSVFTAKFRDKDIFSPRHPNSIIKIDRSADPFDVCIIGSSAKNSDSTSFFSHLVGLKEVSREVVNDVATKRMNFVSNPVFVETPKFVDL